MPDNYEHPVEIEHDEDGRFVVAFPDFGWGATDGTAPAGTRRWPKPRTFCARSSRPRFGRAATCPSRRGPGRGGPLNHLLIQLVK